MFTPLADDAVAPMEDVRLSQPAAGDEEAASKDTSVWEVEDDAKAQHRQVIQLLQGMPDMEYDDDIFTNLRSREVCFNLLDLLLPV